MTRLDDKLRLTAKSQISKFGKSVTYTSVTRTRNDTTGETEETSTVHSEILATPPASYAISLQDGSGIQQGDVRMSFAALDLPFTPTTKDRVTFDTLVWRVIRITPIYSGELQALWTLQLRQ